MKAVLDYTDEEVRLCYECAGFLSITVSNSDSIKLGLKLFIEHGLAPTIEQVHENIAIVELAEAETKQPPQTPKVE